MLKKLQELVVLPKKNKLVIQKFSKPSSSQNNFFNNFTKNKQKFKQNKFKISAYLFPLLSVQLILFLYLYRYIQKLKAEENNPKHSGNEISKDQKIKNLLKKNYQKTVELIAKDNEAKFNAGIIFEDAYFNLKDASPVKKEEPSFNLTNLNDNLKNINSEKNIIASLLSDVKSGSPIVIAAPSGMGKSIFFHFLTKKWADNVLFENIEYLILIKLDELKSSDLSDGNDSLAKVWYKQFTDQNYSDDSPDITKEDLKEILLKTKKQKVLILLDGFDQLDSNAFFLENLTQYPTIITSRPEKADAIKAEKRLTLTGFTDQNIDDYIKNFSLISHHEQKKQEAFSKEFSTYLKDKPNLKILANKPILLQFLCYLFDDAFKKRERENFQNEIHLPETQTEIYAEIINKTERYLSEKLKLSPTEIKALFSRLEKRSYELLFENKENEQIISLNSEDNLRDMPILSKLPLTKSLSNTKSPTTFEYKFVHESVKEYLAASYFSKLIPGQNSRYPEKLIVEQEVISLITEQKYNQKYSEFWPMVSGCIQRNNKARLQWFFDVLYLPPRDLVGIFELGLLTRCLNETAMRGKLPSSDELWQRKDIFDRLAILMTAYLNSNENSDYPIAKNKGILWLLRHDYFFRYCLRVSSLVIKHTELITPLVDILNEDIAHEETSEKQRRALELVAMFRMYDKNMSGFIRRKLISEKKYRHYGAIDEPLLRIMESEAEKDFQPREIKEILLIVLEQYCAEFENAYKRINEWTYEEYRSYTDAVNKFHSIFKSLQTFLGEEDLTDFFEKIHDKSSEEKRYFLMTSYLTLLDAVSSRKKLSYSLLDRMTVYVNDENNFDFHDDVVSNQETERRSNGFKSNIALLKNFPEFYHFIRNLDRKIAQSGFIYLLSSFNNYKLNDESCTAQEIIFTLLQIRLGLMKIRKEYIKKINNKEVVFDSKNELIQKVKSETSFSDESSWINSLALFFYNIVHSKKIGREIFEEIRNNFFHKNEWEIFEKLSFLFDKYNQFFDFFPSSNMPEKIKENIKNIIDESQFFMTEIMKICFENRKFQSGAYYMAIIKNYLKHCGYSNKEISRYLNDINEGKDIYDLLKDNVLYDWNYSDEKIKYLLKNGHLDGNKKIFEIAEIFIKKKHLIEKHSVVFISSLPDSLELEKLLSKRFGESYLHGFLIITAENKIYYMRDKALKPISLIVPENNFTYLKEKFNLEKYNLEENGNFICIEEELSQENLEDFFDKINYTPLFVYGCNLDKLNLLASGLEKYQIRELINKFIQRYPSVTTDASNWLGYVIGQLDAKNFAILCQEEQQRTGKSLNLLFEWLLAESTMKESKEYSDQSIIKNDDEGQSKKSSAYSNQNSKIIFINEGALYIRDFSDKIKILDLNPKIEEELQIWLEKEFKDLHNYKKSNTNFHSKYEVIKLFSEYEKKSEDEKNNQGWCSYIGGFFIPSYTSEALNQLWITCNRTMTNQLSIQRLDVEYLVSQYQQVCPSDADMMMRLKYISNLFGIRVEKESKSFQLANVYKEYKNLKTTVVGNIVSDTLEGLQYHHMVLFQVFDFLEHFNKLEKTDYRRKAFLKNELFLILESYLVYEQSFFLGKLEKFKLLQPTKWNMEGNESIKLPTKVITLPTDFIWNPLHQQLVAKIKQLEPGEEYYFLTGWNTHAIYAVFTCIEGEKGNYIATRLDNLGGSAKEYHVDGKPYLIGICEQNNFEEEFSRTHLVDLLRAQNFLKSEMKEKIYLQRTVKLHENFQNSLKEDLLQYENDCALKTPSIGLKLRLKKFNIDPRWLLGNEIKENLFNQSKLSN